MSILPTAEFRKLKHIHYTIDTYSGFQWVSALSSEKVDSIIILLLGYNGNTNIK